MQKSVVLVVFLLLAAHVTALAPSNPGDLNGDSSVGVPDVMLVVICLGQNAATCQSGKADPNNDGTVNLFDFVYVSRSWGATYTSTPPPSGLVAAYGFEETSGTSVLDSTSSGNNGILQNGATRTSGKNGQGGSFDGINDLVQLPDLGTVEAYPFTFSAWFKTSSTKPGQTIIAQDSSSSVVDRVQIYISAGFICYNVRSSAAEAEPCVSAAPYTNGQWHHIAGVSSAANNHKFYIDGVLAGSSTTNVPAPTVDRATIGTWLYIDDPTYYYFQGQIDDVRISNRALSQAEVQADMNSPVGNPPPPDTTQPTVSVTAPAAGASITSTTPFTAIASDNVAVASVQFRLDGANVGLADTTSPYSISFNPTGYSNGAHIITAVATDSAGNTATSSGVAITITNPPDTTPPTASITAPASGTQLPFGTTSTTLSVTTSEAANCRWHTSDVAYASMANAFATTGGTTHSATLNGLTNGGSYTRYVRCIDGSNNAMTASQSTTFTVSSTQPPANSLYLNSAETGCDGSDPNVLLCDDFEDGAWYNLNCDDAYAAGGLLAQDGWCGTIYNDGGLADGTARCGGAGFHSNCAATSGVKDGGNNGHSSTTGNMADHELMGGGAADLYVRFYTKPLNGYLFGQEKWLTFNAGGAGSGGIRWGNLHMNCGAGGTIGSPSGNWRMHLNPPQDACWAQNQGNDITLVAGNWYFTEVHFKLNTPGQANGLVEIWVDNCGPSGTSCPATPTLRFRKADVQTDRVSSSELISTLWFEMYASDPFSTGERYLDQIKVSKVGPIGFMQ